jgi:hypothetical protein
MVKLTGNYLKVSECRTGQIIKFKDEGCWVENTKYKYPDGNPKNDFVIKIEWEETEKSMRLNKTNRDALIAVFGIDTADWVGKEAKIYVEKMLIAGERKDCILLEAVVDDKWNGLDKSGKLEKSDEIEKTPF